MAIGQQNFRSTNRGTSCSADRCSIRNVSSSEATIPNSVCSGDRLSSRAQLLACCRKGNQSPFILLRAICKFLPEPEQKVAESTPMSPASRDFDEAASNGQKPGDNVFSPDSMLVACRELGTQ